MVETFWSRTSFTLAGWRDSEHPHSISLLIYLTTTERALHDVCTDLRLSWQSRRFSMLLPVEQMKKPQGVNLRACLFGCSVRFCSEHTQNVLLPFRFRKLFRTIYLNIMQLVEIPSQFRASSHKRFLNREHSRTRQHDVCMTGYPFLLRHSSAWRYLACNCDCNIA